MSDCPEASDCFTTSCVDGSCFRAPVAEDSPCQGGACDDAGHCIESTCDSKVKDGGESDVDCGGNCPLCGDGKGCSGGDDCKSGVCTNQECRPSGCSDGLKNGGETGIDCSGPCATKCALGEGCSADSDCAVASGDRAIAVRCLEHECTSTKPPTGSLHYYQDFDPSRLVEDASRCQATVHVCLRAVSAGYPMYGLGTSGALKLLDGSKLITPAGAVGHGGKFDGSYCLTRFETDLSLPDESAFSALLWVKYEREGSPVERSVLSAWNHYELAVDTAASTERFLAALATSQATSFDYTSADSTAQVPNGEWHHLALVYDTVAARMTQYLDGAVLQSRKQAGMVTSGAVDVLMGCRKSTKVEQFFVGTLDEVVLYDRALTAAELSDYVRRTKPASSE